MGIVVEKDTRQAVWIQRKIMLAWQATRDPCEVELLVGKLVIGSITRLRHPIEHTQQWRAWLQTTDSGLLVGWYIRRETAEDRLLASAIEHIHS